MTLTQISKESDVVYSVKNNISLYYVAASDSLSSVFLTFVQCGTKKLQNYMGMDFGTLLKVTLTDLLPECHCTICGWAQTTHLSVNNRMH